MSLLVHINVGRLMTLHAINMQDFKTSGAPHVTFVLYVKQFDKDGHCLTSLPPNVVSISATPRSLL